MEMETAAAASTRIEKILSSSTSFSLHSPSLNSLRLHRIFNLFDKNGDGIITIQKISQALRLLGLEADFSDLESIIKSHIKPDNVGLSFEDFISLHKTLEQSFFVYINESEEGAANDGDDQARMQQEESDLSKAFKVFIEDGDGYISSHELQVVLRKLGLPEAKEIDRVEQMITSMDRNHDGQVSSFKMNSKGLKHPTGSEEGEGFGPKDDFASPLCGDKDSGLEMESLTLEPLINQTEERHHSLGLIESNIPDMNRCELEPYCVAGEDDVSKSNLCSMVPDTMGTVVPETGEFGINRWSIDLEEKLES